MAKDAALIKRSDWAREADQWVGKFEGAGVGTGVTVLFFLQQNRWRGPGPAQVPL